MYCTGDLFQKYNEFASKTLSLMLAKRSYTFTSRINYGVSLFPPQLSGRGEIKIITKVKLLIIQITW